MSYKFLTRLIDHLEKNHKFWDIVDPIFNKYYNNLDSSFSVEEIDEDINTLRSELDSFDELKLTDVYENFEIEKYTRVKNKRVWGKLQQSASELYTINKNVIRFDNGKYTINGEEVGDLLWREKMIFEGEQRKRHLIMEEQKRIKAELAKSASLDL